MAPHRYFFITFPELSNIFEPCHGLLYAESYLYIRPLPSIHLSIDFLLVTPVACFRIPHPLLLIFISLVTVTTVFSAGSTRMAIV